MTSELEVIVAAIETVARNKAELMRMNSARRASDPDVRRASHLATRAPFLRCLFVAGVATRWAWRLFFR